MTRCCVCGIGEDEEYAGDFTCCDVCRQACCPDCGQEIVDEDDSGAWACDACREGAGRPGGPR